MADPISNSEERDYPRLLSIVIPAFNEEQVIPLLREAFGRFSGTLPCAVEWIFVDDGSRDRTFELLAEWGHEDKRVRVLQFSRNFGHQIAVTAGLDYARGDAVVIMDADLQDPPELLQVMLERYRDGYDVVYAQRVERKGESLFKRASAAGFYWFMRNLIHKDLPANASDFRLMSRDVVDALSTMREGHRFLRGMVTWVGFRQIAVPFVRPPRAAGTTKYPLLKMLSFAKDAMYSFSSLPLRVSTMLGGLITLGGFIFAGTIVVRRIVWNDIIPGHTAVLAMMAVLMGTMLICVGVLGEYVGRIYDEIKQRPLYLVRSARNIAPRRRRRPRARRPLRNVAMDADAGLRPGEARAGAAETGAIRVDA